jgi:hypothetical protein
MKEQIEILYQNRTLANNLIIIVVIIIIIIIM